MTAVTMPKVAPPALMTDQVYAAIHEAIMIGALPAGHRLRIRDIAAQVGTSVMPVREAIRRLEEAGLAECTPNKGAVVKGLTLDELADVYAARRVLEVEAARQGARAISSAGVQELAGHYERILEAAGKGDIVGVLDADEALLETLYRAGGNPVLTELIRGLWQRCRGYKIAGTHHAIEVGDDTVWSVYQPQLLEAARTNNARAAATATERSIRHAARRIQAQLAEQRQQAERSPDGGSNVSPA